MDPSVLDVELKVGEATELGKLEHQLLQLQDRVLSCQQKQAVQTQTGNRKTRQSRRNVHLQERIRPPVVRKGQLKQLIVVPMIDCSRLKILEEFGRIENIRSIKKKEIIKKKTHHLNIPERRTIIG